MTQFKLIPYTVRISKIGTPNEFLRLDDLNGEKARAIENRRRDNLNNSGQSVFSPEEIERFHQNDIYYILQNYLETRNQHTVFDEDKKTISFDSSIIENREIFGIIKSGEYGYGADFYNVDEGTYTLNARTVSDSEVYPFFFHFYLPEDSNEGKIILQVFGVYGISTVFQREINQFLEHLNYSISFNRMVTRDFLDEMDSSRLIEIRLIKRSVPRDVADQIHNGVSQDLTEERVFKVQRKKCLNPAPLLRQALENRNIDQYEILNEKYSEIKAVVTHNGSRRTITFGGADVSMGEEWILAEDTPLQRSGHPRFISLLSNSREYLAILNGISENNESGGGR
ncbi:MAG: hypothetical protein WC367_01390 [Methanoregula sp.]|jgi:hypothetical protein